MAVPDMLLYIEAILSVVCGLALLASWLPIPGDNGDKFDLLEQHRAEMRKKHFQRTCPTRTQRSNTQQHVVMTGDEFRRAVREDGKQWCVVEHAVVDLARFSEHPGGNFLSKFIGRDATPWFLISHSKTEKAMRMVRTLTVGSIRCECLSSCASAPIHGKCTSTRCALAEDEGPSVPCTSSVLLDDLDQQYLALRESFRRRGMFAYKWRSLMADVGEVYFPTFFGLLLWHSGTSRLVGLLILLVGACRQGMFFHDIGHDTVFKRREHARQFNHWFSLVLWGLDFHRPTAIHSIHHAFVNVVGLDTALEMGPIVTHPSMTHSDEAARQVEHNKNNKAHHEEKRDTLRMRAAAHRSASAGSMAPPASSDASSDAHGKHMGVLQNALFYGLLIWIVWPYYIISAIVHDVQYRHYGLACVHTARFLLCFLYIDVFLPLILAVVLGFAYFAITGSMNHFHMQMDTSERLFDAVDEKGDKTYVSFTSLQSQTVQNTYSNAITDWFLGHFTLHIEHHLFPTMPRRRYNEVSAEVRAFLQQAKLAYPLCSQASALKRFNQKLMNPF